MALASIVYDVPARVILDSAQRAVTAWDLITSVIKSWVFGTIISVVSSRPSPVPMCTLMMCFARHHSMACFVPLGPQSRNGKAILQVSCSWGFTTTGGAKGVGESTTSAVVISLVLIFIFDFGLSFLFFQGQGDALSQLA